MPTTHPKQAAPSPKASTRLELETPAARPVPVALLLRTFGAARLISADAAVWTSEGLRVEFGAETVTLVPRTRAELEARFGAERLGAAVSGWEVSDGRTILEQPDGGTIQWTPDPAAVEGTVEMFRAWRQEERAA